MAATIIQTPGALDQAVQNFLQTYTMGMNLRKQREELAMQRQRLESDVALQGAQAGEIRAKTKQYESELADRDAAIAANQWILGNVDAIDNQAEWDTRLGAAQLDPNVARHVGTQRATQLEERTKAIALEQEREFEESLKGLPRDVQEKVRAIRSSQGRLPEGTVQTLYPDMFPTERRKLVMKTDIEVSPGVVHTLGIFDDGSKIDLGTAAPAAGRSGALAQTAAAKMMYLDQIRLANGVLRELGNPLRPEGQVNITWPTWFAREMITAGRSGTVVGKLLSVSGQMLWSKLSPEQQQFANAQLESGNAFRYLVSGQQTSDAEWATIFTYWAESPTDDQQTRAQKQVFRAAVEQSARFIAEGTSSRVDAMDTLMGLARQYGASGDVINTLAKMRGYAYIEDRSPSPPQGNDNNTSPESWDATWQNRNTP